MYPVQNPLHHLGAYRFQGFCRELLGEQKDVVSSREYEYSGAPQYGVDLVADCADGVSTIVGQCKCYKSFPSAKIVEAADDFVKHLDSHWKTHKITRFILMTACDLRKSDQEVAIQRQRQKFAKHKISFEVWDREIIFTKLRNHPQIVRAYFTDAPNYWVETINDSQNVGSLAQNAGVQFDKTFQVLSAQVEKYSVIFSGERGDELKEIRELQREGRFEEASARVFAWQTGDEWALLDNVIKANILKTAANIVLAKDRDVKKAEEYLTKAVEFDPNGDHLRTRALIEYYKNGAAAGIAALENPQNIDEINLKLSFYLERNQIAAADRLFFNLPAGVEPDVETQRLHSVILLGLGRAAEAFIKISQVEQQKPNWENVKITKAVVSYYTALSAAALPTHPLMWAAPVAWNLVRFDSESVLRLNAAAETFAQILQQNRQKDEQRINFETWRLACLANNLDRQTEAEDYCRGLLAKLPTHPYALAWALTRKFDLDLTNSKSALEAKLRERSAVGDTVQVDEVLALMGIYLNEKEPKKARQLLMGAKKTLESIGAGDLAEFWQGQIAVFENRFAEAVKLAHSAKNHGIGQRIKLMALRQQYLQNKAQKKFWKPLARHLEKMCRQTNDGEFLIELCFLYAEKNKWREIADKYVQLLEIVGTADAVRLSAFALANTRQPTRCLEVLEQNRQKFPDGVLPTELLRLRIQCQTERGALSKAVGDAEILLAKNDTYENLLLLMETQLRKGDLGGLAYQARKLLRRNDVPPKYALRIAKLVLLQDAELAIKIWRTVKDRIPDEAELLNDALQIGLRLGLEAETKVLYKRIERLTNGKNRFFIKLSSPQGRLKTKKDAVLRRQRLENLSAAAAPLHFLTLEPDLTMAAFMHGLPEQNRLKTDLRRLPAVFIRSGARAGRESKLEIEPDANLFLDVSAFLLAADLNILDEIEKSFSSIRVASKLSAALTAERAKLLNFNKAEIVSQQKVLTQLEKGNYEVISGDVHLSEDDKTIYADLIEIAGTDWVDLAIRAAHEKSFVVAPLARIESASKPINLLDFLASLIVTCRAVADNLRNHGRLNEDEYASALQSLNTNEAMVLDERVYLPEKSRLYLTDYVAGVLAKSDLLEKTCRHYQVFVDRNYVELVKNALTVYQNAQNLARWLEQVENRLTDGIDAGIYKVIGVEEIEPAPVDEPFDGNATAAVLMELLRIVPQANSFIWVDDRLLTSFEHAATLPIVTVTDLLDHLLEKRELSEAEYYQKLLELRGGNFRYLPLTGAEILHHLNDAQTIASSIVENDGLAVLRRYSAACLLDAHSLQTTQMPHVPHNANGELPFVLETTGAAIDAIVWLWQNENDPQQAEIKSDWLFDNLFIGKFGVRYFFTNHNRDDNGLYEMGLDIGEFLVKAITIIAHHVETEVQNRRQQYFNWLNNKFVASRIKADPDVLVAAAKTVSSIFGTHPANVYESEDEEIRCRIVYQQLFLDLPDNIRGSLEMEDAALAWIGIRIENCVFAGGKQYPSAKFWTAAAMALNNKPATISPAGESELIQVRQSETSDAEVLAVELFDQDSQIVGRFETSILGALFADRAQRLEWLKKHRSRFDCPNQVFEKEIEEIASLIDPRGRAERVDSWLRQSAVVHFGKLKQRFERVEQNRRGILRTDLELPSLQGLLRHYRFENYRAESSDFTNAVADSANVLMKEETLTVALERLIQLPFKLGETVTEKINELDQPEKRRLLSELSAQNKSPLNKLQLIDLIFRTSSGNERDLLTAEELVQELYGDGGKADFELFDALLRVVGAEFGLAADAKDWSNATKLMLIWAHTGKLFNAIHAAFGSPQDLTEWVLSRYRNQSAELFSINSDYQQDCLHPSNFERSVFLSHFVAGILGQNQRNDLKRADIPNLVRRIAFVDKKLPVAELMRSAELMQNATGCVLGDDRAQTIGALLKDQRMIFLTSSSMKRTIKEAIHNLKINLLDEFSWGAFSMIVGNLPVYDHLRSEFFELIEHLDFETLLVSDLKAAMWAIVVGASQAFILPDDLKLKCESWVLRLAREFNNSSSSNSEDKVNNAYHLLNAALLLSAEKEDVKFAGRRFNTLLLKILDEWNEFGLLAKPLLLTLNAELPLAQTYGLPEILLTIRASA